MNLSLDDKIIAEDSTECILCSLKYNKLEEIIFNQYRTMATQCTKHELYRMLFGMITEHKKNSRTTRYWKFLKLQWKHL